MIEVGVAVDIYGKPFYWHLPEGSSAGGIPDTKSLWDVMWENRFKLWGFAHSHPGTGLPSPSGTDITTFAAIEAALGTRLSWWITSKDRLCVCHWASVDEHTYMRNEVIIDPEWLEELRHLSYKGR